MARKPTAIAQLKLRLREDLRRRLEQAAKKQDVSLNHEITSRLRDSFDRADLTTLSRVAADMDLVAERLKRAENFMRYAREQEDRALLDDLREAGEALVAQIEQQPAEILAREEFKDTVESMRTAIAAVERKYGRPLPHWEE
jgi:HicB family